MRKTAFQWGFSELLYVGLILLVGGIFYFLQQEEDDLPKPKKLHYYNTEVSMRFEADRLYYTVTIPKFREYLSKRRKDYIILTIKDSLGFGLKTIEIKAKDFTEKNNDYLYTDNILMKKVEYEKIKEFEYKKVRE